MVEIGNRIDREDFRSKLDILFCNNTERGGHSNIDVIVMFKCLFIQQLYSLSDELLDAMKLKVKTGIMQDASFITSDPGHVGKDRSHGEEAKTRRCKDGTWAKKGTKSYFGYKLHGAIDEDFGLIRRIKVTTAKVHDSQMDLANEGEARYADKGLFRCEDKRVRCCHEKSHKGPSPKL